MPAYYQLIASAVLPKLVAVLLFLDFFAATCIGLRAVHVCDALGTSFEHHRLQLIPSKLQARELSQSYPETLLSKLFSTEPKRKYAVERVTLKVDHQSDSSAGITLLVGTSGSGKSVLLRLLAGQEIPNNGVLNINDVEVYRQEYEFSKNKILNVSDEFKKPTVRPVVMDRYYQQSACHTSQSNTVEEYLLQLRKESLAQSNDEMEQANIFLAQKFMSLLGISPADARNKPYNLSVSSQFLFRIACACMESVLPSLELCNSHGSNDGYIIYSPILLLDELLDFECTSVSQRVSGGLQTLCSAGAVIVVATHKPHHFTNSNIVGQTITLVGGKVLHVS